MQPEIQAKSRSALGLNLARRTTEERLGGSIFKGRGRNLEDGLKAAFVDIGFEKNAFLHYWDIVPNQFDSGVEIVEREGTKRRDRPKITQRDIPRDGETLLWQAVLPRGHRHARRTVQDCERGNRRRTRQRRREKYICQHQTASRETAGRFSFFHPTNGSSNLRLCSREEINSAK